MQDAALGSGLPETEYQPPVTPPIATQFYPRSRCGMLVFRFVDGHAPSIEPQQVDEAISRLKEEAASRGKELRAVFAEAEDFRLLLGDGRIVASEWVVALDELGACWLDLSSDPPRLNAEPKPLLVAFPHRLVTRAAITIPYGVVVEFLEERSELEVGGSGKFGWGDELTALRDLSREYHEPDEWEAVADDKRFVPLKALPRPADPQLELSEVAVCLHVVTVDMEKDWTEERLKERYGAPELLARVGRTLLGPDGKAGRHAFECPIYHSFEIDVLSYRFQPRPPIVSACLFESQTPVRIYFPGEIRYVAEGMERRIVCAEEEQRVIEVWASLTASCFPETGVRIWHLALLPVDGGVLTELDIICLIALYYHEQEKTDLLAETKFEVDGDGEERSLRQLLARLSHGSLRAERPSAGTIEFDPATGGRHSPTWWTETLSALYQTTQNDQKAFRRLEKLYEGQTEKLLNACCGVVSGLFDYNQMSFAEMQDTLAPDSSAGGYTVWLNRATLTNADPRDEMLERCGPTIGISPYLILPHAVLLHNEFVVDQVDEVARWALEAELPGLDQESVAVEALESCIARLASARKRIEHSLFSEYVPNVFHYRGERELYRVGRRTRGAREKKQTGERLLAELNARLRDAREGQRELRLRAEATAREARDRADAYQREEREHEERGRSRYLTALSVVFGLAVVPDAMKTLKDFDWSLESILIMVAVGAFAALSLGFSWPRKREHEAAPGPESQDSAKIPAF